MHIHTPIGICNARPNGADNTSFHQGDQCMVIRHRTKILNGGAEFGVRSENVFGDFLRVPGRDINRFQQKIIEQSNFLLLYGPNRIIQSNSSSKRRAKNMGGGRKRTFARRTKDVITKRDAPAPMDKTAVQSRVNEAERRRL